MKKYLSLVKFSHTVFAMPFALLSYTLAVHAPGQAFSWRTVLLVVLCMIFARNTAMAFNRWTDRAIDADNPRTAVRDIPAGRLSERAALRFTLINAVLFVASAFAINALCGLLAPVALAVIMGYSYTKRFTALCHLVLGAGLALAPIGAWLAVTGGFDPLPILLGVAVLFWVSGFDIIYALQDIEFDRSHGLHSIPAALGATNALRLSRFFHVASGLAMILLFLSLLVRYPGTSWLTGLGVTAFLGLLVYQHFQVKADDLSRVNLAFFTSNGIGSLALGSLIILDQLI